MKRHLALVKARYYCTLCMFKCKELKILNSHLVSFVPHLRQKETPIACNKYLGNLAYLKESPVSLSFNTTVRDNVPLSHSESAGFWQPSSVASQCHPWFLCHCLRPPTCLILSTFHLLNTICKLCHQQIYRNLPISICQLCHPPYLLIILYHKPCLSCKLLQLNFICQFTISIFNNYSNWSTATTHHIISFNFTNAFNHAYNHPFIYSRDSGSTIKHTISIYLFNHYHHMYS